MEITDEKLWEVSKLLYTKQYKEIETNYAHINLNIMDSTSKSKKHLSYESHGLQASLIKVNGQYVVAARGTSGKGDYIQDLDLTDPDAYQKKSQFTDFQRFIEKMHQLHPDFDPRKAIYTGHSLGGALATKAATGNGLFCSECV